MCLIVVAWRAHPQYALIVAANRDEFHDRPSAAAEWWEDFPSVLGGRDRQAGGSWLAINRNGRFATVTNYREQSFTRSEHKSRGSLISEYVSGAASPTTFATAVDGDDYAGFNLLTANTESLAYISNRGDPLAALDDGIYGLSNASLDTPWSKVERSKERMRRLLDDDDINESSLLELLGDRSTVEEDVYAAHLSEEQARAITAPFIVSDSYGTRCSTVVTIDTAGHVSFTEQRFDRDGAITGASRYSFAVA